MPVGVGGHVVDEVDDAVLQPAGVKAVDDMADQRAGLSAPAASRRRLEPALQAPE
jgi:hypothetical protein